MTSAPAQAGVPPVPQEDQSEQVSEDFSWDRWKGTLSEVASIFKLAFGLLDQAMDTTLPPYDRSISVTAAGKERQFPSPDAFVRGMAQVELPRVESINMYGGYSSDAVNVSMGFTRWGTHLTVRGKDKFAVAGIAKELKAELDKGRRWTQVAVLQPAYLHGYGPWVGLVGVGLPFAIDGTATRTIGLALLALALAMLLVALFMSFLEPRLVPRLELLEVPKAKTVSQRWAGRAFKGMAGLGIAFVGAIINEATGVLF